MKEWTPVFCRGPVAKCSFQAQTGKLCIKKVIENRHIDRFSITFSLTYFSKILFCNGPLIPAIREVKVKKPFKAGRLCA